MANSEVLAVEARLKDYISRNLKNIEKNMQTFANRANTTAKTSSTAMKKFGGIMAGVETSIIAFAKTFGPAALAVMVLQKAIQMLGEAMRFVREVTEGFEFTMSKVKAVLVPTGDDFARLSIKAKELGETTQFTASQAGQAFVEMGKLGLKADEIIAASAGTLNLATVAQVEMAEAAKVTVATMNQFQLSANEANRIVDVMAKSFITSALDIHKFTEAMKFMGPIAGATRTPIEEVTGLIAVLADRAIDGSMAGTAMRRVLLQLADGSSKASKMIAQFNPEVKTLTEKLASLGPIMKDVTTLTDLFGLRSVTAAQAVIQNIEAAKELTKIYQNSEGTAKKFADTLLDNVTGASIILKSAQEGLAMAIGESFGADKQKRIEFYTELIREATDLVKRHKDELTATGLAVSWLLKIPIGLATVIIRAFIGVYDTIKATISAAVTLVLASSKKMADAVNWLSEAVGAGKIFDTTWLQQQIEDWATTTIKAAGNASNALLGTDYFSAFIDGAEKAKIVMAKVPGAAVGAPPPEVGVPGETDADKKARIQAEMEVLQKKLEANEMFSDLIIQNIQNGFEKERVLAMDNYQSGLSQVQQWEDQEIITIERAEQMRDQIEMQHSQKRIDIAKTEAELKQQAISQFLGGLTQMFNAAAKQNKEFAEIAKAVAIAEATWNTYVAATAAYRAMAKFGPVFGAIAAAGAIAAGLANVAQIKAQKFARGTGYAPGGLAMVGEEGRELVALPRGSRVFNAQQTRQITNNTTNKPTVVVLNTQDTNFRTQLETLTRDRTIDWNRIFATAGIR